MVFLNSNFCHHVIELVLHLSSRKMAYSYIRYATYYIINRFSRWNPDINSDVFYLSTIPLSFVPLRYSVKTMNETQDFTTAIVLSKHTIQTKMLLLGSGSDTPKSNQFSIIKPAKSFCQRDEIVSLAFFTLIEP